MCVSVHDLLFVSGSAEGAYVITHSPVPQLSGEPGTHVSRTARLESHQALGGQAAATPAGEAQSQQTHLHGCTEGSLTKPSRAAPGD